MRRWIAVTLAGATAAATLALGATSVSAATKYTCTKKADGLTGPRTPSKPTDSPAPGTRAPGNRHGVPRAGIFPRGAPGVPSAGSR
jgi:hypothetical protein